VSVRGLWRNRGVSWSLPAPDPAQLAAEVEPREFNRLLGIPRDRELEGLLAERADWARGWYAANGRPYLAARRHGIVMLGTDIVRLESGVELGGRAFTDHLRRYGAHAMVGMAVSAGVEVDVACDEMWKDGRPDEGYFLERFAVAVVERLIFAVTLGSCQAAEEGQETLTPHLSPGCGEWELSQQHVLWTTIFPENALGPIRLLESGGLSPKNSILAAAGVTRTAVAASPLDACRSCRLTRCGFRRAPYRVGT
jgi:hypothetical protein